MPARAYWYDENIRNLIVLELSGEWKKEEYAALMDESLVMLKSVSHPAVIIQHYVSKRPQAFSSAVMKIWFSTYKQWTETETYANFWISVSHGYWERLFVWTLSGIYNPTDLVIVSSLEKAASFALKKLEDNA